VAELLLWCSGGAVTEEMMGKDEAAFITALELHVTGALCFLYAFQLSAG
jgi:hypothetical protein